MAAGNDENSIDQASLDPVLTQRTTALSPAEERQATIDQSKGVLRRLAAADAAGPTIRQRTQSEIIDLSLLRHHLGNPFSTRWIPFEQLREMTTDLMLAFGWWMTVTPIARAEWFCSSPDAQLAAAVDEALRPVIASFMMTCANSLWYGAQPGVKRFKLGRLSGTYRDPTASDPDKDIPVWTSSADALLWKSPATLNPSHCLPQWNDDGEMIGYKFSQTPIPHFDLISAASAYGYMTIPGHFIGPDYALWVVNEQELQFGSVFGSARTKRAYPYWWCNPPEAPILMDDYSLKPIGEVKAGDVVIGWDRGAVGKRSRNVHCPRYKLCKSTVLSVSRRRAKMVKVTFESGHVIRCTPDHKWLRYYMGTGKINNGPWMEVKEGRILSRVMSLVSSDENKPFSRESLTSEQLSAADWLGGMYDGEGSGSYIGQHAGHNDDVRARLAKSFEMLGFAYTANDDTFWIKGGREEIMRFVRLAQPIRTRAMDRMILGGQFRRPDRIVSVEPDGEDEALGLTTTTGNYIAWGLASKNSKGFRHRLADRSYENLADPPKYVYYPVEFDEFIDQDDPNSTPVADNARNRALQVGEQMRSGSTSAFPGEFAEGADGKTTGHRKWEAGYYDTKNNFADLDASIRMLDVMLLRSWFMPEQAFIEGQGSRTAGGSAGGTGGARMATQLGQIYEESQQLLVTQYDEVINTHLIPQFIAANFPEKIGTPCRKVSRSLGVLDEQIRTQVLTLIGQVRGEVLPVDIRKLLEQMNLPLLNEEQMKREIQQISELAAIMQPPEQQPEKVGTQGYNAGVMKTQKGNFYYQAPERIVLAESDGFMNSLPDTPHYRDVGVRSALVRLRRVFLDRYEEQYRSFADFLGAQPTLHLAQQNGSKKQSGLDEQQARTSAAAIVGAWAASRAPGAPGHASQVAIDGGVGQKMGDLVGKIALSGGTAALKGARLDAEEFGAGVLQPWVQDRVKFALDSIDSTVREEAQNWLAARLRETVDPSTVSEAAKEHFSDFPSTHADRVARTESAQAFNRGTLDALHLAGVAQVQAHDASDGSDHLTDAECQAMNGRVMSVEEAKELRDHPNGTRYFTPLSTERLSVERVSELPSHLAQDGLNVAYDEARETLYLTEQIDEDIERTVLLTLGSQLELR